MTEITTAPETDTSPEDSPKRRQILDGARQMFLSKGFEGASVQDIARAAQVSKGTLYVYFDNKEAMFEALVMFECGRMQETLQRLGSGSGTVSYELNQIALHMIRSLLHPEKLAAMRTMIGAGERFPELARQLYQAGPYRTARVLAEYLERRCKQGDLEIEDCLEAASEFLDLVFAGQQRRALLMMPPLNDTEIEAHVARRVAHFLSMYAPKS